MIVILQKSGSKAELGPLLSSIKLEDDIMAQAVWKHYDKFDKETGEWIGVGAIPVKEPDFVKMYITNVIGAMENLDVTSSIAVFICLCKYATYLENEEMGVAVVGEYEVEHVIAPATKLSKSRIYGILKELCNKELIRKVGRARYQINPIYVAKGQWSDINKMIITWERESFNIRFE